MLGPQRLREHGWPLNRGNALFQCIGGATPLLQWQAQHGFAGVAKSVVARVAQEHCVESAKLPQDEDHSEALTLAVIMRILGAMPMQEAMTILLKASKATETPLSDGACELSDEVVHDVCLLGEQTETVKFLKEIRAEQATRAEARTRVMRVCERVFPKSREAAADGAKKGTKASLAKAAAEAAARRERFYAAARALPFETLRKEAPPVACYMFCDERNGRFLVAYPGHPRRSFSWTQRGQELAALFALQHLWEVHSSDTGAPIPAHILGSS